MSDDKLSSGEQLLENARFWATLQWARLKAVARERLDRSDLHPAAGAKEFDALMNRLPHVRSGRHFTRDEMNER